jgi:hypothetical protein
LDYALGSDGPSLSGKSHDRSLILVHGEANAGGYFIVFDEVSAGAGDKVHNYLHPANQTTVSELSTLEEYSARIDHYPSVSGTSVSFYYVTPPDEVNIEKSPSAVPDRYPGYPDHNRLEAVYSTDEQGKKNLATVIFPYSSSREKADFERISGPAFNGCSVRRGTITDFVFESSSDSLIQSDSIQFRAGFCLTRLEGSASSFYLAAKGTYFSAYAEGFESDNPVTVYARGTEGLILSDGAKVKLTGPGLGNVQFEPALEVLSSGPDFMEVQTQKGKYSFK